MVIQWQESREGCKREWGVNPQQYPLLYFPLKDIIKSHWIKPGRRDIWNKSEDLPFMSYKSHDPGKWVFFYFRKDR